MKKKRFGFILGRFEKQPEPKRGVFYSDLNNEQKRCWWAGFTVGLLLMVFVVMLVSVVDSDIDVPKQTLNNVCRAEFYTYVFDRIDEHGNIVCQSNDYEKGYYKNHVVYG